MNIWVFNHYAELPSGMATRTFDIARMLVRRGHRVTVFASSYSHYRLQEQRTTARHSLWSTEAVEGVRFVWIRTWPYRANDWRRMLNMASFAVSAGARGLAALLRERPGAVIGVSVHPGAALAGLAVARVARSRFFLEVPDLWPQVLIDFGRIAPDGLQARILRGLERILFHRAERILSLWRNIHGYVEGCGTSRDKVVWLPHAIDRARYSEVSPPRSHPSPFTVMYLGSFVQSMSLDTILDAATLLQHNGSCPIRFVLVGDGTEKIRLVERVRSLALQNVDIRAAVPKTQVPAMMAEADAFVCCLRNSPVFQYGISMNKLCDYLYSGRPTVFAGESTYDPVAEAGAGFSVRGDDPHALAEAVVKLARLPHAERCQMGTNGIDWINRHHELGTLTDRLEAILTGSTSAKGELAWS